MQWTQFSACSTVLKHRHIQIFLFNQQWQEISIYAIVWYILILCQHEANSTLYLYSCRFVKRLKYPAAFSYFFRIEKSRNAGRAFAHRFRICKCSALCFLLLIFNSIVNIPHKNLILPQVSWRKIVPSYIRIYIRRDGVILLFFFYFPFILCMYILWAVVGQDETLLYRECDHTYIRVWICGEFRICVEFDYIRLSTCQL